jgi:acetyl-CoA synthetase
MLPDIRDYEKLRRAFAWRIPERFNIGTAVCDAWAARDAEKTAIIEASDNRLTPVTYGALRERSNRLANVLRERGVGIGDRVAILLPQMSDVAVAHIAIYKLGAIAVPLAALFGVDAIAYRLKDAGVKALITNDAGLMKLRQGERPATLETVVSTDGADGDAVDVYKAMADASVQFEAIDSGPDDPAVMVYTSGTTGPPKGALHAHRVLLGHLPGVQFTHEFLPQPGDRLWTPADWAWAGGLFNVMLPALYFGVPVVARKFDRFDGEAAFELMARAEIRNAFIPPTALRMLRAVAEPRKRFALNLRTISSAGEALGAEVYDWSRQELGMTVNEFYGQTECNYVLGSCAGIGISRGGAIGVPIPGHRVAIIRDDGSECAADEHGQIAMLRPDPVMFLGYWNNPEATQAKFIGDWMITGDQGYADADGYFHFIGRDDDVISSAGYRIGPGEIEDCLLRHPAVANAAAIGKPDDLRGEIVKVFIVLREGFSASDELAGDIQGFVRTRLSAHEYPREIAFETELPMTTTGKIIRRLLRDRA